MMYNGAPACLTRIEHRICDSDAEDQDSDAEDRRVSKISAAEAVYREL